MEIHPRYPDLVLVDAAEVSRDEIPVQLDQYREALRAIVGWAWSYLCQPHEQLGRRGAVCPYARASLNAGTFFLTVRPGRPGGPGEVAELLDRYREWFVDLEPHSGRDVQLKTILALFPDLLPEDLSMIIDKSQQLLKSHYVKHGFMIGEFHDGPPDKGGLRNESFRPLTSPVPMLVIRHMVSTDLAFLDAERQHFEAYLHRFGDEVPAGLQTTFEAAAERFELHRVGGGNR